MRHRGLLRVPYAYGARHTSWRRAFPRLERLLCLLGKNKRILGTCGVSHREVAHATTFGLVPQMFRSPCLQRSSMVPLAGRGQGAQRGGHAGHRAERRPVVVEETEDSGSEDSEANPTSATHKVEVLYIKGGNLEHGRRVLGWQSGAPIDWRDYGRLDHLMFDYRPRVYIRSQRRLIGETMEDWTVIFQDLTSEGVRWTGPWWYIERVTVSSYILCVPLCGLFMALAYYLSRVARQYGRHQTVPDYTRFKGGLITQRFLSRFISTWPNRSWLQAYSRVGTDLESADLLTARFLLGPDM
ncbi:hypothetical protein JCGZ_11911 [Jatropha curcas]|uniref:Aminotransferase-like plant mobile domain-containing protein n=1 Tax=Jatropha curcas TaxID=180498 RepID=A0A067KQ61_JATCU|nr:hypothetical protein JCGZ_11911 [Jatropha curcas]